MSCNHDTPLGPPPIDTAEQIRQATEEGERIGALLGTQPMSSDPMREALSNALTENGISEGVDGLHGWRCAHPDRYGPCTCVAELLDDLAAALTPLIEARVREARAEALTFVAGWQAAREQGWDVVRRAES